MSAIPDSIADILERIFTEHPPAEGDDAKLAIVIESDHGLHVAHTFARKDGKPNAAMAVFALARAIQQIGPMGGVPASDWLGEETGMKGEVKVLLDCPLCAKRGDHSLLPIADLAQHFMDDHAEEMADDAPTDTA